MRRSIDKVSRQTSAWLRAFNKGPIDALDTIFAQHLVMHFSDNLIPSPPPSLEGLKEFLTLLRTAFPDLKFTPQSAAGQGRTQVFTWAARGTHAGLFMRIKPTGRKVAYLGTPNSRRWID